MAGTQDVRQMTSIRFYELWKTSEDLEQRKDDCKEHAEKGVEEAAKDVSEIAGLSSRSWRACECVCVIEEREEGRTSLSAWMS